MSQTSYSTILFHSLVWPNSVPQEREGVWYSRFCNRQVEQWKTTIDIPHMNLIIFPLQRVLPLCSSTVNQLWFSTVQLAVARLLQSAVLLLQQFVASHCGVQDQSQCSILSHYHNFNRKSQRSKSTVKPQAAALAVIMRLQRKLPDPFPLSWNRVWPHKTTISMCISFV